MDSRVHWQIGFRALLHSALPEGDFAGRMNPQAAAAVPKAPAAGSAKSGLRKMTTTAPDKELGRSRQAGGYRKTRGPDREP